MFIASYFKGVAFKWFDQYLQNWLDLMILDANKDPKAVLLCLDVKALTNKMIVLQGEEDKEGAAKRRLKKLRQTGLVAIYLSKFKQQAL